MGWLTRGVEAKMPDGDIVVSRFEIHSRAYANVQTNIFWEDMSPIIMG